MHLWLALDHGKTEAMNESCLQPSVLPAASRCAASSPASPPSLLGRTNRTETSERLLWECQRSASSPPSAARKHSGHLSALVTAPFIGHL